MYCGVISARTFSESDLTKYVRFLLMHTVLVVDGECDVGGFVLTSLIVGEPLKEEKTFYADMLKKLGGQTWTQLIMRDITRMPISNSLSQVAFSYIKGAQLLQGYDRDAHSLLPAHSLHQ